MPKKSKNRSPSRLAQIGIKTPDRVIARILSKYKHKQLRRKDSVRADTMHNVSFQPLLTFERAMNCSKTRAKPCTREAKLLFMNDRGCPLHRRKSLLAKGAFGRAYRSCCGGNKGKACDYVTKYIRFHKSYTQYDFFREVMYAQIAGNAGLAPKILESYVTSSSRGVIVMERVTGPRLADEHARNLRIADPVELRRSAHALARRIGRLLGKLHRLGIAHGDSHDNNIIQDRDGKWKLIDFGMASEFRGSVRTNLAKIQDDYNSTLLYRESKVPSFDSHEWAYIRHYYKQLHEYLKKDLSEYSADPYTLM